MSGSGRVHTERVESELSQAVYQPAIAAPEIENPGACWLQGSDNLVEVLPPSRIGHTPEPYPLSLPHRHLWQDEDQADDDYQAGRGPADDRGCCSRCCLAYPGRAEVIAGSGFDLGIYGCAARDSNPEPAD